MGTTAHVIGNGKSTQLYQPAKGFKLTCNLPSFAIDDVYATCLVDFKIMGAIAEGSVEIPGEWVLGYRPKLFCQANSWFHIKHAGRIKEFFTELPKYAQNYTNFNCGHMAAYYAVRRLHADSVHLYGLDSLFSMDLSSASDLFLTSDRALNNNHRLADIWRPIWENIFKEFPGVQFTIHSTADTLVFPPPPNVKVEVHRK